VSVEEIYSSLARLKLAVQYKEKKVRVCGGEILQPRQAETGRAVQGEEGTCLWRRDTPASPGLNWPCSTRRRRYVTVEERYSSLARLTLAVQYKEKKVRVCGGEIPQSRQA